MSLRNYLKGIADALRSNGANNEPINAQDFSYKIYEIAEQKYSTGVAEGYNTGQEVGYKNGHEEGYHQGEAEGYKMGYLDASPQETVSGEAISTTDISPIEHNMAVSVRGKNLIPFPYESKTQTKSGVTFTVNDDGTITLNGTATANTTFVLKQNILLKKGSTYTISGCPSGGSPSTYVLYIQDMGYHNGKTDTGKGNTFTAEYEKYYMWITINNGTTINNLVFKPQLEKGTIATSYAPYIKDISTVKLYSQGKNLLDKNNIEVITAYIDSAGQWAFVADSKSFRVPCLPNTTYTIMGENPNNTVFRVGYAITEDVPHNKGANDIKKVQLYSYYRYTSFTPITITTGNDAKYLIIQLSGGEWDKNIDKLQIEIGNSATEYEPYIEPTMYDVPADGTVEGVKSLYPSTTLYTDTSGAVIDCTYYQDVNKVKENLTNKFASTESVTEEVTE